MSEAVTDSARFVLTEGKEIEYLNCSTDVGVEEAPKGYISLEEHHGLCVSVL